MTAVKSGRVFGREAFGGEHLLLKKKLSTKELLGAYLEADQECLGKEAFAGST